MNTNEAVTLIAIVSILLLILRPGSLSVSWRAGNNAGRLNYKPEEDKRQNISHGDGNTTA